MSKLLSADLSRLFRLRSFRIVIILNFLANILNMAVSCWSVGWNYSYALELGYMFRYILVESGIVTGFLICEDMIQSTVRNKIIAGCSRFEIFMSSWITCFICILLFCTETVITICASGAVFGAKYPYIADKSFGLAGLALLFVLVSASFFTAVYTTTAQTSAVAVPLIIVGLLTGFGISVSNSSMNELTVPKYIDEAEKEQLLIQGRRAIRDPEDPTRYLNPDYHDIDHPFEEAVCVLSPISHLSGDDTELLKANITAVSAETVIFFAGGYLIFRRRNIK